MNPSPRSDFAQTPPGLHAAPGAGPTAADPVLRFAAELGRLLGRHLAEAGPHADRPLLPARVRQTPALPIRGSGWVLARRRTYAPTGRRRGRARPASTFGPIGPGFTPKTEPKSLDTQGRGCESWSCPLMGNFEES